MLARLLSPTPIDVDTYRSLFTELLASTCDIQTAGALALLTARPDAELSDSLLAVIPLLQQQMLSAQCPHPALDIVGTGGDGHNTLNFSTATAIALAAGGITICKHGNRRVTSRAGSADVLAALGFNIHNSEHHPNFRFYYAPNHHPVLAKLARVRSRLNLPTLFNLCGPLLNPATPSHAIIGVNHRKLLPVFARVCQQLHFNHVMIVHTEGLDELACLGQPEVVEVKHGQTRHYTLDIDALELAPCTLADLQGHDANSNGEQLRLLLSGHRHPARDTLCLNMAAGLYLMGHAPSLAEGVATAKALLDSGIALDFIQQCQTKESV